MNSSQLYNAFLHNILHKLIHSSSDSFTVSFNTNESGMLVNFCDSICSLHFFEYRSFGNKYYKIFNGLISGYSINHEKKLITFKCDSNHRIAKLDLITKKLYLKKILFDMK